MGWFEDTFLTSLDKRFDEKKTTNIWLTEKQVAVCQQYMKRSEYYSFLYIVRGEYQYSLAIMKKGYGRMVRESKEIAFH